MDANIKTKILVIEDEEAIRQNIVEILNEKNFHAISAKDGQEGIEKAKTELPDLVLCDIMMPGIDGYTVLTELQSDPLTAFIPFIFLSAKTERDDQRLGMELGADDYITKPCQSVELLSAITIRLKKQAAYAQQYQTERIKAIELHKRVQELQRRSSTQEELLQRISEELRDPLSNITVAIQMLKIAPSDEARSHYLRILQQECWREVAIINQLSNLKELLQPENLQLLQRINQSL